MGRFFYILNAEDAFKPLDAVRGDDDKKDISQLYLFVIDIDNQFTFTQNTKDFTFIRQQNVGNFLALKQGVFFEF